jgi:hypothetical protein
MPLAFPRLDSVKPQSIWAGTDTLQRRGTQKNCKKIKEVLTRFRHFRYKRRFILKFKLHFITRS